MCVEQLLSIDQTALSTVFCNYSALCTYPSSYPFSAALSVKVETVCKSRRMSRIVPPSSTQISIVVDCRLPSPFSIFTFVQKNRHLLTKINKNQFLLLIQTVQKMKQFVPLDTFLIRVNDHLFLHTV
jgi:hypothetical protein